MIFARKWSRLLFKKKIREGKENLIKFTMKIKASQLVLFHKPLTRNIFFEFKQRNVFRILYKQVFFDGANFKITLYV